MAVRPFRSPLRLLSVLVFAVLVASGLAGALLVHSVVADEQSRLLHDSAQQAGLVVEGLFAPVGSTLPSLAASVQPGDTSDFVLDAGHDLGVLGGIGALEDSGGRYRSLAAVGTAVPAGGPVAPDRSALASRARAAHGVVSSMVATSKGRRVSFALAGSGGVVVYEDLAFGSAKPINLGSNGPFSDIDGALYASPRPDPAALILTTTAQLPLTGAVVSEPVMVGTQHWTMVARARRPLGGSLAPRAPWAVLAAGLLAALLATILVETLARRRSYAMRLVEERTVALRDAEAAERAAREGAETANRAKSEFLSRMSHELRTPLNAILGFGQLLELDDLADPQRESVDQILKGGRHLLDLINEVLDISRIEAGTLTLSPEPVLVSDAVNDVTVLLAPLAEERGVRVRVEGGGDDGALDPSSYVRADRQRLKQILLNLVANAIKYNRQGGEVVLSAHHDGAGRVHIAVADTGPGISEENIAKLFVPFERLGAEATGIEGTGVGLALSRRLAEAMDGTVAVSSTVGEGSRFRVELPRAEGPLQRYERLHGAVPEARGNGTAGAEHRRTVLYVEDNLSNLRLIERVLGQRGDLEILPAMQGRLGLTLARDHRPDLILLDLHLPDLGGSEVLRELQEDPATSGIPVVVLSADATPSQVERLTAAGASAYLTKPLDVRELLDTVDSLVDHARVPSP